MRHVSPMGARTVITDPGPALAGTVTRHRAIAGSPPGGPYAGGRSYDGGASYDGAGVPYVDDGGAYAGSGAPPYAGGASPKGFAESGGT
mmetsp:Transcript_14339/g.49904  ORF Transcript_14339/g.49904 Transcript_14339/m.49904 type:complete len:89 (+) Transcript_14339:2424-2690(+)